MNIHRNAAKMQNALSLSNAEATNALAIMDLHIINLQIHVVNYNSAF